MQSDCSLAGKPTDFDGSAHHFPCCWRWASRRQLLSSGVAIGLFVTQRLARRRWHGWPPAGANWPELRTAANQTISSEWSCCFMLFYVVFLFCLLHQNPITNTNCNGMSGFQLRMEVWRRFLSRWPFISAKHFLQKTNLCHRIDLCQLQTVYTAASLQKLKPHTPP